MDIPGVGSLDKNKKVLLVGGVLILAGIVYYRHKNAAATTSATTADINPATGYPTGSPEDLNALAAQAAQGGAPVSGGGGGGGTVDTNGTNVPNATTSFTDNGAWEKAAVDYLSGLGESATGASAALGKYVTGQPVNAGERSYVDQAIAALNQPPVAGPNGYPPHIHMVATSATVTLQAPSIRVTKKTKSGWTIYWAPVKNASEYHVYVNGRLHSTTLGHDYNATTNGAYTVYAIPASGTAAYRHSQSSNTIHVTGVK